MEAALCCANCCWRGSDRACGAALTKQSIRKPLRERPAVRELIAVVHAAWLVTALRRDPQPFRHLCVVRLEGDIRVGLVDGAARTEARLLSARPIRTWEGFVFRARRHGFGSTAYTALPVTASSHALEARALGCICGAGTIRAAVGRFGSARALTFVLHAAPVPAHDVWRKTFGSAFLQVPNTDTLLNGKPQPALRNNCEGDDTVRTGSSGIRFCKRCDGCDRAAMRLLRWAITSDEV